MKKFAKLAVALLLSMTVAAFAFGCSSRADLEGEYSYEAWGLTYGAKVMVSVSGDKIDRVLMLNAGDWVSATSSWTDPAREVYLNNTSHILKAYEGHTVEEVLGWEVALNDGGVPQSVSEDADPYILVSGATQSCGRLLLAVQDALSKLSEEA